MLKLLTPPQLNILRRAKLFFLNRLPNAEVRSMFRETRTGMSVGLAYTEGDDHFIVRETIGGDWDDDQIDAALSRLVVGLALSIANVARANEAA